MGFLEYFVIPYSISLFANKTTDKLNSLFRDNEETLKKLFVESFIKALEDSRMGILNDNTYYLKLIDKIKIDNDKLFNEINNFSHKKNMNFFNIIKDGNNSEEFLKIIFIAYGMNFSEIDRHSLVYFSFRNLMKYYEILFFKDISSNDAISIILKETLKIDNLAKMINIISDKIIEFDNVQKLLVSNYLKDNSSYMKNRIDFDSFMIRKYELLELAGFSPKISGKDIYMKLTDIFIPLKINSNKLKNNIENETYIVEDIIFDEKKSENNSLSLLQSIINILDNRALVILGDPGSGKSTLLKYITRFIADNRETDWPFNNIIPLLIKVSEYAEWYDCNKKNLFEYIISLDSQYHNVIIENLEQSNLLILLDGLDEITDSSIRNKIVKNIIDLKARYPYNRYIVTSRLIGYRESSLNGYFLESELLDFTENDIKQFSNKWYNAIALNEINVKQDITELEIEEIYSKYQRLAKELFLSISRNNSVIKFAKNPLLMTIIAMIFFQSKKLPNKRVELYDIATETFLDNWVRVRFQENSKFKDKGTILEILPHIAFEIHSRSNKGLIEEHVFKDEFIKLYQEVNGVDLFLAKKEFVEFKEFLEKYTGFFYRKDIEGDLYGFVHLTFEEYLAALELKSKWDLNLISLDNYVFDARWSEVLRLAIANIKISNKGISGRVKATNFITDILNVKDCFSEFYRLLQLVLFILIDDVEINNDSKSKIIDKYCLILKNNDEKSLINSFSKIFGEIIYSIYRDAFLDKFEELIKSENDENLLINIYQILIFNSKNKFIFDFVKKLLYTYKQEKYFFKAFIKIGFEIRNIFKEKFLIKLFDNLLKNDKNIDEKFVNTISHLIIIHNVRTIRIEVLINKINSATNKYLKEKYFQIIIQEFILREKDIILTKIELINDTDIKQRLKTIINFLLGDNKNKESYKNYNMYSYQEKNILTKSDISERIWDFENLEVIHVDDALIEKLMQNDESFSDEMKKNIYNLHGEKLSNNIEIYLDYANKNEIFNFFGWKNFPLKNLKNNPKELSKFVLIEYTHNLTYGRKKFNKEEEKYLHDYYENKEFFNNLEPYIKFIILKELKIVIDENLVLECYNLMNKFEKRERECLYNLLFEYLNPFNI